MSIDIFKIDLNVNFTDYAAKHIEKHLDNYEKIVFISANKRPVRFVEQNSDIDSVLKTDFFTIEEFVKFSVLNFSDIPPFFHSNIEREFFFLDLIKEQAKLYQKLGNSEIKVFPWARRLSNLFNEIDMQLLSKKLSDFKYVEAIDEAREILENLKSLYKIYEKKYEDFTFNGNTFKRAVKITNNNKFENYYRNTLFIFAGLVYLSGSELEIIKNISLINHIDFFIQTDLKNREKEDYNFETFSVVNKVIEKLKKISAVKVNEIKNDLKYSQNIEFYQFPDTHSEANFISETIKSNYFKFANPKSHGNIAVILPEANTLFPLLSYIGKDEKININIALGYPFKNTEMGIFLHTLFLVVIDIDRRLNAAGKYAVDSKILLKLLNTAICNVLKEELIKEIEKIKNYLFETLSSTYLFDTNNLFFNEILKPFLNIKNISSLCNGFVNFFQSLDNRLLSREKYKFTAQILQYFYNEIIESLRKLPENREINLIFSHNLINELINNMSMPFEGHPLEGVQITGMLEARLLSFKHLIIADVNEGILPSGDKIDPLLPEQIKTEIGLTSFKEKENLMRYNFFRLIYSCENISILIKTGSNSMEKFIRSRFVEQIILQKELKDKKEIKIKSFPYKLHKIKSFDVEIEKNDEIRRYFDKLLNKGNTVSPSRINFYMNCPYAYYLKYIKKIEGRVEFSSEFEADSVGIFVHKILEESFKKYLGEIIDENNLKKIISESISIIKKIPEERFDNEQIKKFFDKLSEFQIKSLKLILEFRFNNFFNFLKDNLEKEKFKVIAVEKELKNEELQLHGFADRIDEVVKDRKFIRIVDYKTGYLTQTVNEKKINGLDVSLENFDAKTLESVKKIIGSVQMPCYILTAKKNYQNKPVQAVIYSLGSPDNKKIEKVLTDQHIDFFKDIIVYILNHMKKSGYIYPLPDKQCDYCDYNYFCKYV